MAYKGKLTSADDLNDYYLETGYYDFSSGNYPANLPSDQKNVNGMVFVYRMRAESMARQLFLQWSGGIEYAWVRRWFSGSYGNWQTLY